ncbi:MAG: SDR family NAD(P)-dependent oxidoreductase, partial [Thermovirga sp.]|nr:SDR family NAD(P)-dependent oxidoreductase [Thermovirga sp.]
MELDKSYYKGKTAVVTGAASGIGLALIEELLAYGAEKVVLADFNAVNLKKHTDRLSAE